jgi:hypothetical protein
MYAALHHAEQMLPHLLESIQLPDLLPNVKTLNVICYDFVPQLLSILQNQKLMSANNLVLDPNNPLAMYKPPDGRLCEALSGSAYRDIIRNGTIPESSFFNLFSHFFCVLSHIYVP